MRDLSSSLRKYVHIWILVRMDSSNALESVYALTLISHLYATMVPLL